MGKRLLRALFASSCFLAAAALTPGHAVAADDVPVVADAISGIVTGPKGPEAGVWVIAETEQLPTRFIKIVVTDDQGRYLVPELPKAKYKVWVRGYGLVDSKPVEGVGPGKSLDLKAVPAPDAAAAAEYYPANYWLSLIHVPAAGEFPGTGRDGNGIAPGMKSQQEWVAALKQNCASCHQQGDKATRELGDNTPEGWGNRIMQARAPGDPVVGDHGAGLSVVMQNFMAQYGRQRALNMFADWTQRIAKGELPTDTPPRPEGIERNVVLTLRDWSHGKATHDEAVSDRRDPTVNADGPIYATSCYAGYLAILYPKTNKTEELPIPSVGGGTDIMDTCPHSMVVDQKSRVWLADLGRIFLPPVYAPDRPDFCTNASDKYANYFPMPGKLHGQIIMYDPATKRMTQIPDCFGIQHVGMGTDKDNTVYFSGGSTVVGWIDTKLWDETHDAGKAMGWCPMVLDTKEKGVTKAAFSDDADIITPDRTQWNEPGQPQDPRKDTRFTGYGYGMDTNMVDGSVWFTKYSPYVPSGLIRFDRGANPPETCKTEYYEPPKLPDGTYRAFAVKGMGIDSKGIVWGIFNSGHFGAFDRNKCKVLRGPTATGQQCPEGWTFYQMPGPQMPGMKNVTADYAYLGWVDIHDTLGLGKDIPIAAGSNSDSILALMPGTGKVVTLRVPYPRGFFPRGMDGRIDDPKAGWKGKGMWASYNMTPVWHQEGGDAGYGPEIVKFQVRPDPLAH